MTRLIDADALKEDFSKWFGADDIPSMVVEDIIDNAPTVCGNNPKWCENCVSKGKCASTRPHGKWIEEPVPIGLVGRGNGQYRCSNCKHGDIQAKTQEVPYCWFCGAKMEKKEADNEINN